MQAQPRARRHADERMMALASALVRVVTHGRILLLAVAGVHRRVPVGDEVLGQRGVEFGLGTVHPLPELFRAHLFGQTWQGIFAAHAFHVHQRGDGGIIIEPAHMAEASAFHEGRE